MTPEEQFRRLRDTTRWTVAPLEPRRHAPVHVAFAVRWVLPVVAVVVVGMLVLVGVQSFRGSMQQPAPVPTDTPTSVPTHPETSTPSPAPTATQTLSTWTSPPSTALGGDCSALFSNDQAKTILGASQVSAAGAGFSIPGLAERLEYAVAEHNGGLVCSWDGDNSVQTRWLVISRKAFPDLDPGLTIFTGQGVRAVAVSNGYVLIGWISDNGGDGREGVIAEAASQAFASAVSSAAAPMDPWTREDGQWSDGYDCDALYAEAGVWDAVGRDPQTLENGRSDNWPSWAEAALQKGHGLTQCSTTTYGETLEVSVLAGGAWIEDDVAKIPGARKLTIRDSDSSWTSYEVATDPGEGEMRYIYAFDGDNVLSVSPGYGAYDDVIAAVPRLLRTLDSPKSAGSLSTSPQRLTTAGWGPIKLGSKVPLDNGLVSYSTETSLMCTDAHYWSNAAGVVVATDSGTRAGKVNHIWVYRDGVQTKSGVHVGTPRSTVEKLFPDARELDGGDMLVVADSLGQVVFEFAGDVGGDPGTVHAMQVVPVGAKIEGTPYLLGCD